MRRLACSAAVLVAMGAAVAAMAPGCANEDARLGGAHEQVLLDFSEVPVPKPPVEQDRSQPREIKGIAHIEQKDSTTRVIVRGNPGPAFNFIWDGPVLVDDKVIYTGVRKGKAFVVFGDVEKGPYEPWIDICGGPRSRNFDLVVSPDGRHVAVWMRRGKQEFVILDGVEGKPYDVRRYPWRLEFSPDSNRLAYVASKGENVVIVVDSRESAGYDSVFSFAFSLDSKHWAAKADRRVEGEWRHGLLVDGVEAGWYDSINGTPCFSPDMQRVAYVAERSRHRLQCFLVVDGVEGNEFDPASNPCLTFSPDSRRAAYVARRAGKSFAVFDDVEGRPYERVLYPRFSSDSRRTAYLACSGDRWFVVVDGKEGKPYENCSPPVFSPDSRQVAYTAVRAQKEFLVVVGSEIGPYEAGDSPPEIVFDSPTSLHVIMNRDGKPVRLEVRLPLESQGRRDAGT
ncbi:MAG: hypothetical protein NT049_00435 [Planctomycetota bacterium]|nr:hypothetical protein [Planctomycetota bacterium]